MSIEFQAWNLSGYIFYVIYTIYGYIEQQADPNMKKTILVNDICFAIHGLLITLALCYQCYLWFAPTRDSISTAHVTMICCMWTIAVYNFFLAAGGALEWYSHAKGAYAYSAIHFLGFGKSFVSFIKYTPQAYMNWKRQSTNGFAIHNVLLDFGGGFFAFSQMFIDAYDLSDSDSPDWGIFLSNVPKLVVSCESMFFDALFMTQHYILYGDKSEGPILNGTDSGHGLLDDHESLSMHANEVKPSSRTSPSLNSTDASAVYYSSKTGSSRSGQGSDLTSSAGYVKF